MPARPGDRRVQRIFLTERGRVLKQRTTSLEEEVIPIVCYLIQTGDGANILIDSGLPWGAQPPTGIAGARDGQNCAGAACTAWPGPRRY
jgi:hypothetical protein